METRLHPKFQKYFPFWQKLDQDVGTFKNSMTASVIITAFSHDEVSAVDSVSQRDSSSQWIPMCRPQAVFCHFVRHEHIVPSPFLSRASPLTRLLQKNENKVEILNHSSHRLIKSMRILLFMILDEGGANDKKRDVQKRS